ncbi:SDR family NAD(P)-dependent oxidoreductase [Elioraea tepidiphila]|jgi:NAD(P)-dependent dehydrogenase (short-subunit alcohol dehydrogenase family)|uniref:SDR family NAD(P)-dependent oxidoreductase n=1 Tax=Elioraea tepidiphila TaxID=457934 RepID=UPI002FD8B50E
MTAIGFRLHGRCALVTGASRGIGRATAEALAAAGAAVTLAARAAAELAEGVAAIRAAGGQAEMLVLDVTDTATAKARIAETGPYDILVNNAGINRPKPFLEMDEATFDALYDVNVRAAYFVAQAVARGMVAGGKAGVIVNVSSQMGVVGGPNRTVYCGTKHAVEGMTKAMALELAPRGIRVVTIAPTFVETALAARAFADPVTRADILARIPMGRPATVEEVAASVVYLCSPAAGMVTGTHLLVDGGWTAQ